MIKLRVWTVLAAIALIAAACGSSASEAASNDGFERVSLSLGTPIEFDFPGNADAIRGDNAAAVGHRGIVSPRSSAMLFVRATGFASEDERAKSPSSEPYSESLETWFAHPEVLVESQSQTTVSGLDATVTDIMIERSDELRTGCGAPPHDQCINFVSSQDRFNFPSIEFRTAQDLRIWEIDDGGNLPIIIASIAIDGDDEWNATAEAIMETIVIGDPEA